jgi:hypothetical protein
VGLRSAGGELDELAALGLELSLVHPMAVMANAATNATPTPICRFTMESISR